MCYKLSQTGWLKQQIFEVWKSSTLRSGCLPRWVLSEGPLSGYVLTWPLLDSMGPVLFTRALILSQRLLISSWPPLTLIPSRKPHLQIPSPWGSEFQYMNLGGNKHPIHNRIWSAKTLFPPPSRDHRVSLSLVYLLKSTQSSRDLLS